MIFSNLHTHTTFCDGKNTPREMADAAIALGFHTLGFSGHSYTAFDDSFCLRDPMAFAAEIRRLKEEYRGLLHILLGTEWDVFGEVPYEPEYVIGAVHYVHAGGVYYPIDHKAELQETLIREVCGGDPLRMVSMYFDTVAEMAEKLKPDIIGHFDVIGKFNEHGEFFDEKSEGYLRLARSCVDRVLPYCNLFEVNTGAIRRGYRSQPYPGADTLRYIRERGGRVILSSDTHAADGLNCNFAESVSLIAAAGFTTLTEMTPNGWREVPIT